MIHLLAEHGTVPRLLTLLNHHYSQMGAGKVPPAINSNVMYHSAATNNTNNSTFRESQLSNVIKITNMD